MQIYVPIHTKPRYYVYDCTKQIGHMFTTKSLVAAQIVALTMSIITRRFHDFGQFIECAPMKRAS